MAEYIEFEGNGVRGQIAICQPEPAIETLRRFCKTLDISMVFRSVSEAEATAWSLGAVDEQGNEIQPRRPCP